MSISDGGDDTYDVGNMISVNGNYVDYSSAYGKWCASTGWCSTSSYSWWNSGSSSWGSSSWGSSSWGSSTWGSNSYYASSGSTFDIGEGGYIFRGQAYMQISTTAAHVAEWRISGNLGADGIGTFQHEQYYDADSNLFGYRKSVCEADLDPSVNHLWITSAAARDWGYSTSTDDDEDTLIIEPGTTLTLVIYWSWKGTCVRSNEHQEIFNSAVLLSACAAIVTCDSENGFDAGYPWSQEYLFDSRISAWPTLTSSPCVQSSTANAMQNANGQLLGPAAGSNPAVVSGFVSFVLVVLLCAIPITMCAKVKKHHKRKQVVAASLSPVVTGVPVSKPAWGDSANRVVANGMNPAQRGNYFQPQPPSNCIQPQLQTGIYNPHSPQAIAQVATAAACPAEESVEGPPESWNNDSDLPQPYCRFPLRGPVASFVALVDWQDQGWGNQKGRLLFCLSRRGQQTSPMVPVFDLAPHARALFTKHVEGRKGMDPDADALYPPLLDAGYGDELQFFRITGGGGGHALTVNSFRLTIKYLTDYPRVPFAAGAPSTAATSSSCNGDLTPEQEAELMAKVQAMEAQNATLQANLLESNEKNQQLQAEMAAANAAMKAAEASYDQLKADIARAAADKAAAEARLSAEEAKRAQLELKKGSPDYESSAQALMMDMVKTKAMLQNAEELEKARQMEMLTVQREMQRAKARMHAAQLANTQT